MIAEEVKPFKYIRNAYFELDNGHFLNEAAYNFYCGCKFMQMRIYGFNHDELKKLDIDKTSIVYGGVDTMMQVFRQMGIKPPMPLDIPSSLVEHANRKIYYSTIQNLMDSEISYPVFIKPSDTGKLFNGSIVSSKFELETYLVYNKTENRDIPIMVSEIIDILSEYRVFVLDGKILDCRKYLGDYRLTPDYQTIENIISNYKDAPIAYAMDVAVTADKTSLLEINDAYSLGTYGLDAYQYLRMIMMRWLELTARK